MFVSNRDKSRDADFSSSLKKVTAVTLLDSSSHSESDEENKVFCFWVADNLSKLFRGFTLKALVCLFDSSCLDHIVVHVRWISRPNYEFAKYWTQ